MAVPPPGEEERDSVSAADEVVVDLKPQYYNVCALMVLTAGFSLARYMERGDTFSLGSLVFSVSALALVPVMFLRFPSRAAMERRTPSTALRMERAGLFLMWAACGVMLLVGFWDLLSGHFPWPVNVLRLAGLVPLALSVEAYVRGRWRRRS
ncbi:hypothetical protein [Nocardiopsis halotolerans]|uniref:hypothetical protein n=1 Tax=Nocardiopsis halotolerans TaxID=124252 RepID=UPI000346C054|nr:hypothetical protein [Nocardiopsis halotolerans]